MSDVFLNKFYESAREKEKYLKQRISEIKNERLKSNV
jgi:hypothetical protein